MENHNKIKDKQKMIEYMKKIIKQSLKVFQIPNSIIFEMLEQSERDEKQNKKAVPKGAFLLEHKKNYHLIRDYILCKNMYEKTAPFRYNFLSYVVVCSNDPKLGKVNCLYHESSKRLILTSYQVNSQFGSKYVIKCGRTDQIVGRLRGDFMRTKYQLFDSGFNPKKNKYPVRKQLGYIEVHTPSFLSNDPYTLSCIMANHRRIAFDREKTQQINSFCFETQGITQVQASKSELYRLKQENSKKVYELQSIKPKYCHNKKGYIMDMKGLITEASPLNSIMMTLGQDQCLVMGKRSQNTYLLFVGAPLTLLQGFGIFLANMTERKS